MRRSEGQDKDGGETPRRREFSGELDADWRFSRVRISGLSRWHISLIVVVIAIAILLTTGSIAFAIIYSAVAD